MTRTEVERLDEENLLLKFAEVKAPAWRLKSDSPTLCPDEIYLSPKGWIPAYPAGTGDAFATLGELVRATGLEPEWIER